MAKRWMTPREVARMLGCHVSAVHRWAEEDMLPTGIVTVKNQRRFREEDVLKFKAEIRGEKP